MNPIALEFTPRALATAKSPVILGSPTKEDNDWASAVATMTQPEVEAEANSSNETVQRNSAAEEATSGALKMATPEPDEAANAHQVQYSNRPEATNTAQPQYNTSAGQRTVSGPAASTTQRPGSEGFRGPNRRGGDHGYRGRGRSGRGARYASNPTNSSTRTT